MNKDNIIGVLFGAFFGTWMGILIGNIHWYMPALNLLGAIIGLTIWNGLIKLGRYMMRRK